MVSKLVTESRKARHEGLVERATKAVASLVRDGVNVTFYSVAQRAGIARSTLYRCADLRSLVVEGRKMGSPRDPPLEGAEAGLEQALLERDVLLRALNALHERGSPCPCRFAFVRF